MHVKAWPVIAVLGQETVMTSGCGATVTSAVATALMPLASMMVNVSTLEPLTGSVRLILPVPVYGPVPPVAETVHVKALPAVIPVGGHAAVATRGWASTVTEPDPTIPTVFASTTVKVSVFAPLRFSVRLKTPVPW